MVKVAKFGGSSLSEAKQFKKVRAIVEADKTRRYVIPSAPGKRFGADVKVTDMLYACYDAVSGGADSATEFRPIADRFNGIIADLKLNLDLSDEYNTITQNFAKGAAGGFTSDYAASRGEYLNGIILAYFLGFDFIDAAGCICFRPNGEFDSELTNATLSVKLNKHSKAVIPGFYGALPNGEIKTFSRGGSDFTGSIAALAAKASLYENWTDVSGVLVADPRIVQNPAVIHTITYRELRELSYMGATVLHEDAIFPVRAAGIPINIRNTNEPDSPGTLIVPKTDSEPEYVITGIAGKKGFSAVNIEKAAMNNQIGFLRRILTLFEAENINFEHIPTGIDTMSIILATNAFEKSAGLDVRLKAVAGADSLETEHGLALIAVVGRGMKETRGTAARICAALSHSRINIRIIDQGSSELNIIVGVREEDFEPAIKVIYDMFMS